MGAFATRQVVLLPFPFSDAVGKLCADKHAEAVGVIVNLLRAGV